MTNLKFWIPRSVRWFVLVGALNTGIYYAVYLLLYALGIPYLTSHLMATAFAMACSYFLNCKLTFRIRPSWRTFLLFPIPNLANVVITTTGMHVIVTYTSIDQRIAPLPVTLIAIPLTYLLTRYLMVGGHSFNQAAEREAHDEGHLTRLEELKSDPVRR